MVGVTRNVVVVLGVVVVVVGFGRHTEMDVTTQVGRKCSRMHTNALALDWAQ